MTGVRQTRRPLAALLLLCLVPSLLEASAVIWGVAHGYTGEALRDGLDFWAGGFLAWHGHAAMLSDPVAYRAFLAGLFGKLPVHLWSYPPNYLLLAALVGWLPPWPAVLAFDLFSLLLLAFVLRRAGKSGWFIAAMLASPVVLENALEHQNATLMTALIGGGLLLIPRAPRLPGARGAPRSTGARGAPVLGGVLIGLATIKPQLGLVLPLVLLRRSRIATGCAALAAVALGGLSFAVFGTAVWAGFWQVTRPAMDNVLLTGQPPEFAGGLVSVFAACRSFGVHTALVIQGAATLAAIALAARCRSTPAALILGALASPYLHPYDLMGAVLATALLVEDRLTRGFAPGEAVLYFIAWFTPGLLPWTPYLAHGVPLLLLALLASAMRSDGLAPCDSSPALPGSPASSAGRSPIPDPPGSTAPG
ncbi:MAG: hypothetical protein B7X08_00630 [Acidocella sp. 20-63-7]|nr:MAG: hypothetical protein B7X08_00630 [Acidocella sp. 20-63-7]